MPDLFVTKSLTGYYTDTSKVSGASSNVTNEYASFTVSRAGGTSPGWPKSKRTNNFVYQRFFKQNPYGVVETSVSVLNGAVGYQPHCYRFGVMLPPTSKVDDLTARLKADFLTALKGQKVNVAVAVAERKQAMKMIAGTATGLAESLSLLTEFGRAKTASGKLKAGRKLFRLITGGSLKQSTKGLANTILSWKYGWKPLVQDLKGLAEEIARIEKPAEEKRPIVLKKRMKLDWPAANELVGRYRATQRGYTEVSCYARYTRERIADVSALGVTNIPAALWELTTLSFVLDWVIGVGDFLNNLDASLGLTFLDGGLTIFEKYEMVTVSQTNDPGYRVDTTATDRFIGVRRASWLDFPTQALPIVKNPFKLSNAISAAALVRQRT